MHSFELPIKIRQKILVRQLGLATQDMTSVVNHPDCSASERSSGKKLVSDPISSSTVHRMQVIGGSEPAKCVLKVSFVLHVNQYVTGIYSKSPYGNLQGACPCFLTS